MLEEWNQIFFCGVFSANLTILGGDSVFSRQKTCLNRPTVELPNFYIDSQGIYFSFKLHNPNAQKLDFDRRKILRLYTPLLNLMVNPPTILW